MCIQPQQASMCYRSMHTTMVRSSMHVPVKLVESAQAQCFNNMADVMRSEPHLGGGTVDM